MFENIEKEENEILKNKNKKQTVHLASYLTFKICGKRNNNPVCIPVPNPTDDIIPFFISFESKRNFAKKKN